MGQDKMYKRPQKTHKHNITVDGIIITNQSSIVEILAEQFAKTSEDNDTNQCENQQIRNSRSKTKLYEKANSLNNIFS